MRRSGKALSLSLISAAALSVAAASAAQKPEPTTTPGTGPYPALFEQVANLPDQVVYRPRNLAALGKVKLGIYVFGNGGCSADGTSSRNHLLQIASHGYLAIAPGTIPTAKAKAAPSAPAARTPGPLSAATPASALSDAIDWAVRENGREGSPYYGRIAVDQIAASGWSCGGLQAIVTAQHLRVKTVIVMNSGVFNNGDSITGISVNKSMVDTLHGSALYVLGGPSDIAYENGMDDYRRINEIPVAMINIPVGHGGTYMAPNGGVGAEVVTSWLAWKLRGDKAAAGMFEGSACGYCRDPRFTLQRKNIQ